tara:strand:+ start:354 stop:647 length:294 start_codon:yes stop_codon:yes gene_type:complete
MRFFAFHIKYRLNNGKNSNYLSKTTSNPFNFFSLAHSIHVFLDKSKIIALTLNRLGFIKGVYPIQLLKQGRFIKACLNSQNYSFYHEPVDAFSIMCN